MKKITNFFLVTILGLLGFSTNAQTEQGGVLLEVGATPFSALQLAPSTSLQFYSTDGITAISIGGEGGYFIADDFALKIGLGLQYTDREVFNGFGTESINSTTFLYKLGFKYYANSVVPIQLDVTGFTVEDGDTFETPDPFWMGVQAGYAVFFNENVSFEPSLRYNVSLNDSFTSEGIFEARFGFAIFF